MTYLIDANIFIEAHLGSYPLDVVPSFWKEIARLAHAGDICSIDKVKAEIFKNDDDLSEWCEKNLPDNFFKDSTVSIREYTEVAKWANSKKDHYKETARRIFLDAQRADAWLAAFAKKEGMTVVTLEKSNPESKKNIKLPDACNAVDVPSMNTIALLRIKGIKI